ncbi:tryptophan halogenase family protein [Paraglaciecola sp.]|uniref:tryptophan halogenase family protein n=1 Tax=Paraglaciecola sp. TaxID=1920173 RepID=UPI003EF20F6F
MNIPDDNKIKKFVIVGGGTAGWFSAAILARALLNTGCKIELVESPNVQTIGVGEATIPSIIDTLNYLKIPLQEFIKETNATFKLGIKFTDWHTIGEHYWHQFGYVGGKIDNRPFYQHWLKYKMFGGKNKYTDFSPSVAMAKKNKFHIGDPNKPNNLTASTYAFHFDAGLVAEYLTGYSTNNGVMHTKAHVRQTNLTNKGFIESLTLDNGKVIQGDFFIDCTGQQALLIEKALKVDLENWQEFLPVDRAIAVQTENLQDYPPYTESIAHKHGWRWKIPLQNRTGNGYVYCSEYCDDETAKQVLQDNIVGEMLTEPRVIKFTTGKRDKIWFKNCLAVGLSSGFLEPLESTSISLIIKGVMDFVDSLPDKNCNQATIDEYNRLMDIEYECIRDFLVLHYCQSSRTDSNFWLMWKDRQIPDTLSKKLALFQEQGRLIENQLDLFTSDSWYAVLEGMGVFPKSYDPLIDASNFSSINDYFVKYLSDLDKSVDLLMSHESFVKRVTG